MLAGLNLVWFDVFVEKLYTPVHVKWCSGVLISHVFFFFFNGQVGVAVMGTRIRILDGKIGIVPYINAT